MMKRTAKILYALTLLLAGGTASAQHTLGIVGGVGMSNGRFQPHQETRAIWGQYNAGLTWRHYGSQRAVGCFGLDLELMQQGFSFATNASRVDDPSEYLYYTRRINSVMLPVVWQPHVYLFNHHLRVFLEAAATFSYNLSSTYESEQARENGDPAWKGTYRFKTPRDNRFGYGLAGGGGIALLVKQLEVQVRVRYYFGYSDIVRNRNKYAGYTTDGTENPFYATPLRSPLDNLNISVGVSYRFNKEGFESWKPRPKREKNHEVFKYTF